MISFRKQEYMYSYNTPTPKLFSTHLHHYYELLLFVDGDATYIVDGTEYAAKPGDLFITRPDELHSIVFRNQERYERHFVQFSAHMLSDLDIDLLKFINNRPLGKFNKIPSELVYNHGLEHYFDLVQAEVTNYRPESDLLIKTYIIQILVKINDIFSNVDPDSFRLHDSEKKIKNIKEYIENNISEPISLESLSAAVFMNKYYLCHLFKECTGLTVKEYINVRRIHLAKQLLSEGKQVTSIYSACGFGDYSSFFRTFKRISGKAPRDFLNQ